MTRSRSRAPPTPATTARTRSLPSRARARSRTRTRTPGLPRSGGGTITLNAPGLTESGNTVTVRTSAAHNRSVGDIVVIAGAGNAGYNGTWTVASVTGAALVHVHEPDRRAPQLGRRLGDLQLAVPGADRRPELGRDRRIGAGLQRNANIQNAINAIAGLRRHRHGDSARPRRASRSPTAAPRRASTSRMRSSSTSAAAAASPRSRRRTTAARTTRSGSRSTATPRRRSRTARTTRRPGSSPR